MAEEWYRWHMQEEHQHPRLLVQHYRFFHVAEEVEAQIGLSMRTLVGHRPSREVEEEVAEIDWHRRLLLQHY